MGLAFWIPFAIFIVAFAVFLFWIWIIGTFVKVIMGVRIVNLMIAVKIFGLLIMILGVILFVANSSNYNIATTLLQIGLACAVPGAIYLLIWLVFKLLSQDEALPDPAIINEEWFIQQQIENTEREEQTIALTIQLESQLQEKDEEMLKLQKELAEKVEQISLAQKEAENKPEAVVDPEILAKLESEREELETKTKEAEKTKEEMQGETEELKRERELLRAELDRLAEDRKRFDDLQTSIKDAQTKQDEERTLAFEAELLKLKAEQQQKQEELAAELEAAKEQIENELAREKEQAIEEEMAALRATLESYGYTNHYYTQHMHYPVGHPYYAPPQQIVQPIQTTEEQVALTGAMDIPINPADNEELQTALRRIEELENEKNTKKIAAKQRRDLKAAEMRAMFSKENIDKYVKKYFIEVSACFLMDRNMYKDRFGLGPYNQVRVEKIDGKEKVTHSMTATENKFYKFCEILIDIDRFFKHKSLFPAFVELVNEGTSLVRISEKLHLMYTQFYRKDFVKDLRYKEDFDNILVLASHHYAISSFNFKPLFTTIPFNVTQPLVESNDTIEGLSNPDLQATFDEYFSNYIDLGFQDRFQALVTTFVDTKKDKITGERIANIILKETNRVAKVLERESRKKK
ncbi:MAG: hypothetical protein FWE01_03520 [Firmicutes bacterium]|nr:hypothetical protein [Bacillota bacterium]